MIELNQKYPQIEIENMIIDRIEDYYFEESELKNIYYDLQYIIIYLMTYKKNFEFDCTNTKLYYIAKIIEKENYKINERTEYLLEGFDDCFFINQLLSLYEIIELKSFECLSSEIRNNLQRF